MIHTVQKHLDISNFFEYSIKRFEFIFYKIIRYVIWSIVNSKETNYSCLVLLEKEDFQYVLEYEIHEFVQKLCNNTRNQLTSLFEEIMSSPIIMDHAKRYKKMLINDFDWEEKDIEECCDNDIFKPKNIGLIEKENKLYLNGENIERIDKIRKLIKLHIHIRLLMTCEYMTMVIDYNWRRMLDNSKESSIYEDVSDECDLFQHVKNHICRELKINNEIYKGNDLFDIYNGVNEDVNVINHEKLDQIESLFQNLKLYADQLPPLLERSMKIAGDKFL